jgi:hypothetical protein
MACDWKRLLYTSIGTCRSAMTGGMSLGSCLWDETSTLPNRTSSLPLPLQTYNISRLRPSARALRDALAV